jgi:hypothetical protein
MTTNKIRIKIKKPFLGYKEDSIVFVLCDNSGLPLEKFWRDRIRDKELDDCVEVIEEKQKIKKTENKKTEEKKEGKNKK